MASFDTAYEELRAVMRELQAPEASVDALTDRIRKAGELIALCRNELHTTEQEVAALLVSLGLEAPADEG
jgi:exodeoxyribonuclease VII small subunit